MPKPLALALAAIASAPLAATADVSVQGDTVSAGALSYRPGATSAGPRGLPKPPVPPAATSEVRPASFAAVDAEPPSVASLLTEADEAADAAVLEPPVEPAPFVAPSKPVAIETPSVKRTEDPPSPKDAPADERRRVGGGKPRASNPAERPARALAGLSDWKPSTETLTATGGGLAVCIGLIVVALCVVRSFLPKSSRPLPRDVVEVLGRTTLGGRRTAQLVRVGAKLVLVSTTPDGAETLTEITDPDEVARLVALCEAARGSGAEATFQQLFQQMAAEPADASFLGGADREPPPAEPPASLFSEGYDPRSLAAAYANTPGGRDAA